MDLLWWVYDDSGCLVLFGSGKHDSVYNRNRNLVSVNSSITDLISHNYAKIKVDSYDSLRLEKKRLSLELIKLVILLIGPPVLQMEGFNNYHKIAFWYTWQTWGNTKKRIRRHT